MGCGPHGGRALGPSRWTTVGPVLPRAKEERMEGYSVVTTDEKEVGRVVGMLDDYYIVETRSVLRKARHLLPKRYATVDPKKACVLIHMSKELLYGGPKLGRDGALDEAAVAQYWGD
jgi:hypothetical protein